MPVPWQPSGRPGQPHKSGHPRNRYNRRFESGCRPFRYPGWLWIRFRSPHSLKRQPVPSRFRLRRRRRCRTWKRLHNPARYSCSVLPVHPLPYTVPLPDGRSGSHCRCWGRRKWFLRRSSRRHPRNHPWRDSCSARRLRSGPHPWRTGCFSSLLQRQRRPRQIFSFS